MNTKMVRNILRKLIAAEGLCFLLPGFVSLLYGESAMWAFFLPAIVLVPLGLLKNHQPKDTQIYAREGLFIVGLAWVLWSAIGALPFVFSGSIPNYIDAFFETVSGFTTTGATILTDIESLPQGVLFWRSFTHWIGGMGVLVFVLAVLPLAGSRSMYLMKAEVPGPTVGKLVPKTTATAKILYLIYFGMTMLLTILLLFGGMPLFDALIHAFGTAGTGGFSNRAISVAAYGSTYINVVITVFMILFGINFNVFYFLLIRRVKNALKNEELWLYLGIIFVSIALVTLNTASMYTSTGAALEHASFQVASIISTTGYSTVDFAQWPHFSQMILMVLMLLGSCAGSTGGGVKMARTLLVFKSLRRALRRMIHPREVSLVRQDGKPVEEEALHGVYVYLVVYVIILMSSILLLSINNFDLTTSASAVFACLNNVGPGLGSVVGPLGSFAPLSWFSKLVLSIDMLLGRLEIFPILLLVMPALWKKRSSL